MTTLDGRVLAVRSFILGACCSSCERLIRDSREFDGLIAQAIGSYDDTPGVWSSGPDEPEPDRDERIVSTLAAAVLLVVGAFLGGGFVLVSQWAAK